jgi:hypothetical protein
MHSPSRCKYEPEIKFTKTITCTECLQEEGEWEEGWIKYLKKRPSILSSEIEPIQTPNQKSIN